MIKFKLLSWIFCLFAFQLSFSSPQNVDVMKLFAGYETENQLQFEKTYVVQNMTGVIPQHQLKVFRYIQPSKCFLLNYNSKDYHASIIQSNLRPNAVDMEHLCAISTNLRFINVPIYLQTEKFRL